MGFVVYAEVAASVEVEEDAGVEADIVCTLPEL